MRTIIIKKLSTRCDRNLPTSGTQKSVIVVILGLRLGAQCDGIHFRDLRMPWLWIITKSAAARKGVASGINVTILAGDSTTYKTPIDILFADCSFVVLGHPCSNTALTTICLHWSTSGWKKFERDDTFARDDKMLYPVFCSPRWSKQRTADWKPWSMPSHRYAILKRWIIE